MRRLAPLLVTVLVGTLALPPIATAEPTPGFVSVIFGRMQWVSTNSSCQALPNTVDLGTAKTDLDARSIKATGIVITSRTAETGLTCTGTLTMTPGWDTLKAWHADGWSFVSGGTHADMTTLNYEGQWEESCGSLPTFAEHGMDASGVFAYGANKYTTAIQTDPVSTCFEFGRRYTDGTNERSTTSPPWFADVNSVNGGLCNDPALPCYTRQFNSTRRYASPVAMATKVAAVPDTWYAVQFYRFVDGEYSSADYNWDCTSPDWRQHFTSRTEMYCYGDFLYVMNALRTAMDSGVVVTDPETVATAWGRSVDGTAPSPSPDPTPPSVTITHPTDGSTVAKRTWVTITASASDDVGVVRVDMSVNGTVVCAGAVEPYSCRWKVPARPNAHRIDVTARDAAGNMRTATINVRSV